MSCLVSYSIVVLPRPALLQTDNVRARVGCRDLNANFREALIAELGDELEAPAIEREDPQVRGRAALVGSHLALWGESPGSAIMMQLGKVRRGCFAGISC